MDFGYFSFGFGFLVQVVDDGLFGCVVISYLFISVMTTNILLVMKFEIEKFDGKNDFNFMAWKKMCLLSAIGIFESITKSMMFCQQCHQMRKKKDLTIHEEYTQRG